MEIIEVNFKTESSMKMFHRMIWIDKDIYSKMVKGFYGEYFVIMTVQ